MDAYAAYIPIDRRLAIAAGEDLPEKSWGTALFADISGFTPLTETLAAELGPKRGAEELTRQLDTIYGAVIDQVHRFRGTVIGFAGDAITCWFDGDHGLRASACGLAIQQVMAGFSTVRTPSGSTVAIAIKVAAASGPIKRFLVGDPSVQFIDALAGDTLYRMAEAEHFANKGDVVVTPEIAQAIEGQVKVGEWRRHNEHGHEHAVATIEGLAVDVPDSPWTEVADGALSESQTRAWILPGVYERLKAGQGDFLAEIRPVVALFLRFGGIDYDHDLDAGTKLDEYLRWVQRVINRYEGSLLQLIIGDKGSVICAAFGAPLSHDDDAERATSAALELQTSHGNLGYIGPVQIGISRGRMRVGPYGGTTRRTYGILGDDVNIAARLMQRAEPGEILVSERIANSISRHFELRDLGGISVKGKNKPIQVAQVVERKITPEHRSASLYANPLVGREKEVAQVVEMLDTALQGWGQVLRLEGVPGVGKSHLAAELTRQAEARGVKVAVGVCTSISETTAYAPWRVVLRDILGLGSAEPGSESSVSTPEEEVAALKEIIEATNPDWLLRLPLLGDLLSLPIPDNATTADFDPRLRQSALFDLVTDIVITLSRTQPLLIMLDDVHWLDEASQGLTEALARAIGRVPVVLTVIHRPPFTDQPILASLDEVPAYLHISLDELSPEGVEALIYGRLNAGIDPLTLSLIQSITQGNPFFVEEVLDSLVESGNLYLTPGATWAPAGRLVDALRRSGCLVHEDGVWKIAPGAHLAQADIGLPDSVEGVVLSRIDRLPEHYKLTLRVASVIGHAFAFDLLYRSHPLHLETDELQNHTNALQTRDFTRLEVPPPNEAYVFKHNVTHDVAYETLLYVQKRQLHLAVGHALEKLNPEATEQLAHHTFLGEDWRRALEYQTLAGQHAQRLFANHEGIAHFARALRCAENLPPEETESQRQQLHSRLGILLTYTGQYEAAEEHLNKALELAEQRGDSDARARACRWIAYLHEYRGELAPALEWITRGLESLGDNETEAGAELLAIAGLISTRLGNYDEAAEQCESSMRIAELLGDITALAFASNSRAIVSLKRGNNVSARDYHQRALDLYRQAESVHGMAMSYNGIANVCFATGRWPEAYTYYRQAREIFDRTGDVLHQIFADNNLGGIALNQGKLDEAVQAYSAALHSLEQIGGSPYVVGVLQMNLGAAFGRQGGVEKSREHLASGLEYFTRANSRDYLPELHRRLAETALAADEPVEAEREASEAIRIARELTMRGEEGSSLRVLGTARKAQGDVAGAEQSLVESLSVLTEVEDEYELARSQLALASVLAIQGRVREAADLLRQCTEVFERLEARIDLAEARSLKEWITSKS